MTVIVKRSWAQGSLLAGCLLAFLLPFSTFGQRITLSVNNAPLEQVLQQVEQATDYHFIYVGEELQQAKPVTLSIRNKPLTAFLNLLFAEEPFVYTLHKNYISLHLKVPPPPLPKVSYPLHGKVTTESGEPIAGATIQVKGSLLATATGGNGEFDLELPSLQVTLIVSSVGYQKQEVPLHGASHLLIQMTTIVTSLDETVIIAYGKTTRRLSTGSIGKVTAEQIAQQPVANPLATLEGRIPGLFITQNNGLPGADFSVLIRGRNSIEQGTSPLYIIDGTPFISDNLTQRSGGLGNNNPFNSINPTDIESIEVLKDADATAIYGSRGAGGVILITTKRGAATKTTVDLTYRTGWGTVTRTMNYLSTPQYLAMRREAFQNDAETPTAASAPDLLLWDTTRQTDWKKILIGGTAHLQNLQAGLSGGTDNTHFYLGTNYYRESTVYPGSFADQRASANLGLTHHSPDNKLHMNVSVSYAEDESNLPPVDLTQYLHTAPNAPAPYDSQGHLVWSENGASFFNPLGTLLQTYEGTTDRLTASALLTYQLLPSLTVKANAGYNYIELQEHLRFPMASYDPATFPQGAASFASNASRIYNLEPQLEYNRALGSTGRLTALLGATWQQTANHLSTIDGYSYTNDLLLNSTVGAGSLYTNYTANLYRYNGAFGRLTYTLHKRYLLNLTGRRDGSSRFGSDHQLANFYSVGAGWIFSEEGLKNHLPWLSYGKLRGSYGTSGNDQIGNYQYLDTWSATYFTYQGLPALRPTRLSNPDYSWEQNKKLDIALEVGAFNDHFFLSLEYYRNRTGNQIIYYHVPAQTGFTSLLMNFPAEVQNSGWEAEAKMTLVHRKNLSWTVAANLTVPRNKLLRFPGLEQSSYASSYEIGKSLNLLRGYQYTGINPSTGVYTFGDLNKDGTLNEQDYTTIGTTDPSYFGGLSTTVVYKKLQLDLLLQVIHQQGRQPVYSQFYTPGQAEINFPVAVLQRWQHPGDQGAYQRYSQSAVSSAAAATFLMFNSSAVLTDASFARLKNVSLSYSLSGRWMKKIHVQDSRLLVQAQNLLTLTHYTGADPENQNVSALPPLRMISLGIQLTL